MRILTKSGRYEARGKLTDLPRGIYRPAKLAFCLRNTAGFTRGDIVAFKAEDTRNADNGRSVDNFYIEKREKIIKFPHFMPCLFFSPYISHFVLPRIFVRRIFFHIFVLIARMAHPVHYFL